MIATDGWTLGAVIDDREVDPRTHLFVVRADVNATAARELERRLVGLALAGKSTLIVDLFHDARASSSMLQALLRARSKLERRNGRLVISASAPELRHQLESVGLEPVDLSD